MLFATPNEENSDLAWLNGLSSDRGKTSKPPASNKNPNRNRRIGIIIAVLVVLFLCIGLLGLALFRAFMPQASSDATPAGGNVTCQELIDRAMQASGDSCDKIGSNQVCYGNNTLTADLNSGGGFNMKGDVVSVDDLRRLAASPLSLANEEWGIAVFKVLANLPRSLPGETVTMVVFGNTTLDNASTDLQTFYFSSTLGQIECDQVPFDGLMITMPDGAGARFVINGAEMMLMGNASISATQNGEMEVSMYSGSAYITANGESQFVTAGQSTTMDLGGPNGTSAVSPPSEPQPLSPEELQLACTMTGHFCNSQEITPVSQDAAVSTLLAQLGVTPNPTATPAASLTLAPSFTPSISFTPTISLTPSLSTTPSVSPTITRTGTPTLTRTPTRTGTITVTGTVTATRTPTLTGTATATRTPTLTGTQTTTVIVASSNTPTSTSISTSTATSTPTSTATFTSTFTATTGSTPTNTPVPTATTNPCSQISLSNFSSSSNQLSMNISNSTSGNITISTIVSDWDDAADPSQMIQEIQLGGTSINSSNLNNPPVTISSWTSTPTIGSGQNPTLLFQFGNNVTSGYSITVNFTNGCQVQGSN